MGLLDGVKNVLNGNDGNFDASQLSMEECLKLIGELADLDNAQRLVELLHKPDINTKFRSKFNTLKNFI